jgi:hypothetical protein
MLQVVESTGNQMATPRALVEGFAVLEPPVDAEEAAERADDVAALLAAFGNHLHERTAHHLGRHAYASPAHNSRALCFCISADLLSCGTHIYDRVHTTRSSLVPYTVSYKSTVTQILAQADVFYLKKQETQLFENYYGVCPNWCKTNASDLFGPLRTSFLLNSVFGLFFSSVDHFYKISTTFLSSAFHFLFSHSFCICSK